MRTPLASLAFASVLLAATHARAQNVERATWSSSHPVAIGARLLGRGGSYGMVGFGGQLRLRPFRRVAVDLFADNFVGQVNGALRHDHEVGATLHYAIAGNDRWSLQPLLGACAVLAVQGSPQNSAQSVNDIHFGLHAGLGAEFAMGSGFSVQTQAELIGYLGHDFQVYRWTTEVSQDLSFSWVAQASAGLNYYF